MHTKTSARAAAARRCRSHSARRSTCASPQCEGLFQELLADCRACTQAGPELALESFLRLAAKDLVVCRAGVSGCDGVVSSAERHSLQFIASLSF